MTTCSLCGREDLCFTCPYCKGVYCGDHRLPEGHGCPAMHQVREDAKRKVSKSVGTGEYEDNQTWSSVIPKRNNKRKQRKSRKNRFSSKETRDLLIASVLVTLVSLSLMGDGFGFGILVTLSNLLGFFTSSFWWVPIAMIVIFLLSFLGHEMAHKFTAQHYGMWSEFRMTQMGYYLSAFAILFAIPIFGTGTVYTSGTSNREHEAKANLAGPLSNFVFGSILIVVFIITLNALSGFTLVYAVFLIRYGIVINGILGLFNMIPIQPFDGATIKDWSIPLWITLTIALLFMSILGWFVIPMLLL